MQHHSRFGVILCIITASLIAFGGCSSTAEKSDKPVPAGQATETATAESEPDATAKQLAEQERLERETAQRAERERAEKIKFMYEDIYFNRGSYTLTADAKEILVRKAQWLLANPETSVIIEGHTNNRGSKEYNMAFGDRRAGAVKSFLIEQGIERLRLIPVSYGNERPASQGKSAADLAKNRRVHFGIED